MTRHDDSLDTPVTELAVQAVPASEIARRLGVTTQRVHSVLHYLRRHGAAFPPVRPGKPCGPQGAQLTRLNAETRAALAPHAIARGIETKALAVRILDVVIRDNLIDAILDDKETNP
ncbi:hypothetical protein ROSMUCSMR3_03572 [Roseovarius mucosus]|jgi:hypothetical protein|uniref:Uncharacterized protein n=1 Tax=Roseovarius mucosus TaxID=215743 RepID=A0A1V0RTK7_9RHOB|nr:hypothetical protein [Roseovarius mucosus]ARE85026.1 hypothetical protein ROSMUCSMR3_03572 [Roseovarius mucosus]